MDQILHRIKSRIDEPSSPIKTIKSLAEGIDMSQQGFYKMIRSGKMKKGTILAICEVLKVDTNFFDGFIPGSLTAGRAFVESSPGDEMAAHDFMYSTESLFYIIRNQHQETKEMLEAQLQAKDRQLEAKDRHLEAKDRQINVLLELLGKPEGDIDEPHSNMADFDQLYYRYTGRVIERFKEELLVTM